MIWLAVAGIAAVVVSAVVVSARQGKGWWVFLLVGALGWVLAQAGKDILLLPIILADRSAILSTQLWYIPLAALLPGVVEELGKYLPLRMLHVRTRNMALALGLGAGAMEAITILVGVLAIAGVGGVHEPFVSALIAMWERFWAVTGHAAEAALDGLAIVRRQGRWLLAAIAAHTAIDLGAAWYQHTEAVHASVAVVRLSLGTSEVVLAAVAVLVWIWGERLWRRSTVAPQS